MARTDVTVAKDEPYPTGSPPDNSLVPGRTVRMPYELVNGTPDWQTQSQENLRVGGLTVGGAVKAGLTP